jgi:hypothetical protein
MGGDGMTSDTALVDLIAHAIHGALVPVRATLVELSTKVAELERRPVFEDRGVWQAGIDYRPGHAVSHAGSLWLCNTAHTSTGTEPSHTHFRLAVKRGKDGRS